jgi:protein-arginine kinase activator protein McsA
MEHFSRGCKVKDYALSFITITALLKHYESAVNKHNYEEAASIAVDIQLLSRDLQQWAEQCTEIKNS